MNAISEAYNSSNFIEAGMLLHDFNIKYQNGPVVTNQPKAKQTKQATLVPSSSTLDSIKTPIESTARALRPYSMVLDKPVASKIASTSKTNSSLATIQSAELARQRTLSSTAIQNDDLMDIEPTLEQMSISRGSMEKIVLKNGDVLQGGFLFPVSGQIASGYTPLQPYLAERMAVMHPPVPIRCFNRTWLSLDQGKWMRPRTDAEKKKAKVNPNSDLPQNLLMEYVEFNDMVDLFIEYVILYGWTMHAERFMKLKERTINLKRTTKCWMLALRYFILVLEGVMTPSTTHTIPNAAELQVLLLEEAKTTVENFSERLHGDKNPYVVGGKKEKYSPITGELKEDEPSVPKATPAAIPSEAPTATTSNTTNDNANLNNNNNQRNTNNNNRNN